GSGRRDQPKCGAWPGPGDCGDGRRVSDAQSGGSPECPCNFAQTRERSAESFERTKTCGTELKLTIASTRSVQLAKRSPAGLSPPTRLSKRVRWLNGRAYPPAIVCRPRLENMPPTK